MKNILGTDLKCCGTKPMTGYFRDGFCRTTETDRGRHVVACIVNEKFLHFTRQMGNDLSSPNPMTINGSAGGKGVVILRYRFQFE